MFEINPLSVGMLTGVEFDIWQFSMKIHGLERHTWQKQEVFKGRDSLWLPGSLGSTKWWGWGFRLNVLGQAVPAEEANEFGEFVLRASPVFRHTSPAGFYVYVNNLTEEAVNEMLAMGTPALSPSAGQTTNLNVFATQGLGRRDISTLKENGWPRNHDTYHFRWLHSDGRGRSSQSSIDGGGTVKYALCNG